MEKYFTSLITLLLGSAAIFIFVLLLYPPATGLFPGGIFGYLISIIFCLVLSWLIYRMLTYQIMVNVTLKSGISSHYTTLTLKQINTLILINLIINLVSSAYIILAIYQPYISKNFINSITPIFAITFFGYFIFLRNFFKKSYIFSSIYMNQNKNYLLMKEQEKNDPSENGINHKIDTVIDKFVEEKIKKVKDMVKAPIGKKKDKKEEIDKIESLERKIKIKELEAKIKELEKE